MNDPVEEMKEILKEAIKNLSEEITKLENMGYATKARPFLQDWLFHRKQKMEDLSYQLKRLEELTKQVKPFTVPEAKISDIPADCVLPWQRPQPVQEDEEDPF